MNIRPINIQKDRQTLLDFRVVINYASGSPVLRKAYAFDRFRDVWLNSNEPEEYLSALENSMKDTRTIAEIWEEENYPISYVWASFSDWQQYNTVGVEIHDIMVASAYQRRGIASKVIKHVEQLARERGATILRSGTGIDNIPSRELHAKMGFYVQRHEFEKEL